MSVIYILSPPTLTRLSTHSSQLIRNYQQIFYANAFQLIVLGINLRIHHSNWLVDVTMSVCKHLRKQLRALHLVGMMCARFDNEQCLLRTTSYSERYALIYLLIILSSTLSCFLCAYFYPETMFLGVYNKTGNFYENINLRGFCIVLWILYICLYVRRHRHIALVESLLQLSGIVSNEIIKRKHRRMFLAFKVLVLVNIFNHINGFYHAQLLAVPMLIFVFLYTYTFFVTCLLIVFFVCLQQIVAAGVAHYNLQLEQRPISKWNFTCNLIERQVILGHIAGELNQCFGLLVLPIYPIVLAMAPSGPLFILSTVMEGKFSGFYKFTSVLISASLWNVPWLMMISLLMQSNVITVEANKTAKILAKIPRTGTGLDRMVEKFLLKNLRQRPILTAYGFFSLDKSTLFKLFTAIFTYMVILVQFKEMENSTKSLHKA